MDKLILKKIAKRFCKGVLLNSETIIHFGEELSEEECTFLQDEIIKIANKITDDEAATNVTELINQYYTI